MSNPKMQVRRNPHRIHDLRNHSAEAVQRLRFLLQSGASMREDACRPNFFELDDRNRVFYIYVSPKTGTVMFLATWCREPQGNRVHRRAA